MQANEISLPVKPNILKKSVAPHPRISLSFIPACERKKEIFKKTDCLPKNRFRHPAEFYSDKVTISLRLTRGCRSLEKLL